MNSGERTRPRASPARVRGFVNVSPGVAQRGRVKTYAVRKSTLDGTFFSHECVAAATARRAVKASAPRENQRLRSVATKSLNVSGQVTFEEKCPSRETRRITRRMNLGLPHDRESERLSLCLRISGLMFRRCEFYFPRFTSTDRSLAQEASFVPVASMAPLDVVDTLLSIMFSVTMIALTLSARLPPSARL